MTVKLSAIVLDHAAQPRTQIDSRLIEEYASDRGIGGPFPPVTVFTDGKTMWLADGWHRYHAAKKLGKTRIEADVREGDLRDAILYSVGANADHGARRTNADKRRAVETLLSDKEWSRKSDNWIAKACRVGHPLVSEIKSHLEVLQDTTRTVTVQRGDQTFEMDTTKHGTQATSKWSDREIAKRCRVGPPLVAELRSHLKEVTDTTERLVRGDDGRPCGEQRFVRGCIHWKRRAP